MDSTLTAILGALFAAHQQIDAMRMHAAELEARIRELDEGWARQADRTITQAMTVDEVRAIQALQDGALPPGWRLVRDT